MLCVVIPEGLIMMHEKVFSAELDHLYEMLEFIRTYGQSCNIPSSTSERIILAAEEALVNIISYGYPNGKKGTIKIVCEKTEPQHGIKIIIEDHGIPFNPIENAPSDLISSSKVLSKSEESLGGYGIYILIGLMDRVEYQRVEGGNILSLIKYIE
jgi:anti-sigma regulatory factor (Ser/Thr protein kinase)